MLPLLLCVDVEPDAHAFGPEHRSPWDGAHRAFEVLSALRPKLAEATGVAVRFSWFLRMDPLVEQAYGTAAWPVHAFGEQLGRARDEGDEIGVHPHAVRWEPHRRSWVRDHEDAGWRAECIETAVGSYADAVGVPCSTHRFGDRFADGPMFETLERVGIRYDVTLEPGEPEPVRTPAVDDRGGRPMADRAPRSIYRPSRRDFQQRAAGEDAHDVWAIPLSTVPQGRGYWWRPPVRRLAAWARGDARFPRARPLVMSLWLIPPGQFRSTFVVGAPGHLAFAVRTDSFLDPTRTEQIVSTIEEMASSDVAFVVPSAAVPGADAGDALRS